MGLIPDPPPPVKEAFDSVVAFATGDDGSSSSPAPPTPEEVALVLAALKGQIDTLAEAIETLQDQVKAVPDGLTDLAEALKNMSFGLHVGVDESVAELANAIAALRPPPPPPPPAPVDLTLALAEITRAVNSAEATLNKASFMVATLNATVDVQLSIPGTPGSVRTQLNFQIMPKPIA